MVFPSPAPFMMMASADYSPYPMHTPQDSAPRRRHNCSESSSPCNTESNGPSTSHQVRKTKRASKPKPVERVDSGFEEASETSSITFTQDVERRLALRQFMHRRYHELDGESDDEEGGENDDDDVGDLGRRARDSIDMNIGRAFVWEDKEIRARRNRKSRPSRARRLRKWIKKLLYSD